LLACSVLLLTACGPVGDGDDSGTSGSGGAVRDGGTMTVALADDLDMLDPLAAVLADRSGMVMSPKQLDELGADFGSTEPSNFWHHGQ
jgi:hypothetical protein